MQLLCAAIVAILFASNAAAQSGRVFIQGGPLLDGLGTPSAGSLTTNTISRGVGYRWNDINGDRRWQPGEEEAIAAGFTTLETRTSAEARFAPGTSVGVGVFVSPSVSLRFEGSFQAGRATTSETTPQTLGMPDATTNEAAVTDLLVSAGWHKGESRKVTLTYLAGMVFRRQREVTTSTFSYVLIQTANGLPTQSSVNVIDEQRSGSTLYRAGLMAGIDAAVSVSRRVAIVPQLRMVAANGDWHVRPAIAMRWRP